MRLSQLAELMRKVEAGVTVRRIVEAKSDAEVEELLALRAEAHRAAVSTQEALQRIEEATRLAAAGRAVDAIFTGVEGLPGKHHAKRTGRKAPAKSTRKGQHAQRIRP